MEFDAKLALFLHAHFDEVPSECISCQDFVCEWEHNFGLEPNEHMLLKNSFQKGELVVSLASKTFVVRSNCIYGLVKKSHPYRFETVTPTNLEAAMEQFCAQPNSVMKQEILHLHAEVIHLKTSVLPQLQNELAAITFEVMNQDVERYKRMKEETQKIEQVRKLARKKERSFLKPKKYIPKKKHKKTKEMSRKKNLQDPPLRVLVKQKNT